MEQNQETKQYPEARIDGKSKVLFAALAILIAASAAAAFWRYVVKRDYVIQAQTDCDPETKKCFIWECDPMSLEEGEKCTGNQEEDVWYYKIVRRNAKNIPDCPAEDENCSALVCPEGETDCEEILCAADNVPDGEECSDPERYLLENPPEEESLCEEEDEECLLEEGAESECEDGDEECLSAEAECDNESENCEESEVETESDDDNSSRPESPNDDKDVPPAGVEPA